MPDWSPYQELDETVEQDEPVDWREEEPRLKEAQLHKQMMAQSLAYFASEILSGPTEEPYCGRFLVSEHHEEWSDLVHESDRLCVQAARDHGKTWFWTFAYPLWKAVHLPNKNGFIFSDTQKQARRILEDIRSEIENNPRLQYLYPPRGMQGRKWSADEIKMANGHKIFARGFGTRVRGAHPYWIVCDDVLNDETAWSDATRTKQTEFFFNAVTNMIVPGGQIVVVGTPFHALDLYYDIKENGQYLFKRYAAIDEKTKKPLWPERYDIHRLAARRKEIGAIRFTREFMCLPVSDDMSLFPSWLFVGTSVEQPQLKLGMPRKFWTDAGIELFMGVDFALSSSVKADFTVLWVMGLDKSGNRWLVDIVREQGLSYQAQKSLIVAYGRKYDPAMIFLESNQMQRIWGDELIQETDLPITKFITTGQEKHSLEKGLPSLRVLLENKKVKIPRGDARSVFLTEMWKSEMQGFTWKDGKVESIAAHDDMPMAFWICDQAIRQGYFSFTEGVEDEDEQKMTLDQLIQAQNTPTPQDMEGFERELDAILNDDRAEITPEVKDELLRIKSEKPAMTELSIGYGEEDEDFDSDPFTGQSVGKKKDWRPKQGAPVPGGGGPIGF